MKNQVNHDIGAFKEDSMLNAFRERFRGMRSEKMNKYPELKFGRIGDIHSREWRRVEEKYNTPKEESSNLYVSDWQIIY